MKLSRNGTCYLAADTTWQKGLPEGQRLPTGTIVIHAQRQLQRVRDCVAARGYTVQEPSVV